MKRTFGIVVLMVILAVSAFVYYRAKDVEIGNTSGNILAGGSAAYSDGWIYFVGTVPHSGIFKMKADGTAKEKLSDDYGFGLNVVGSWLYFSNIVDESKIYKMKTDGTRRVKISDDNSDWMNVVDGWIYYVSSTNDGQSFTQNIFKMKTDGSEKTKISDDQAALISVHEDWIYYSNFENEICKIKTDGTERIKLSDESYRSIVNGEWIYYLNSNNQEIISKIYKMKLNGSEKTTVSDDLVISFNVSEDWIYFTNANDNRKIYKMKTDGTGKIKLSEHELMDDTSVAIVGDWLFYPVLTETSFNEYWIRTDGTDLTESK